MRFVSRYLLQIGSQDLSLPSDAQLLRIESDGRYSIELIVLANPNAQPILRRLHAIHDGATIPVADGMLLLYIGSAKLEYGSYSVFEERQL